MILRVDNKMNIARLIKIYSPWISSIQIWYRKRLTRPPHRTQIEILAQTAIHKMPLIDRMHYSP
jgi:ribosomal protein L19